MQSIANPSPGRNPSSTGKVQGNRSEPGVRVEPISPVWPFFGVLPGVFPEFGNRESPAREQGFLRPAFALQSKRAHVVAPGLRIYDQLAAEFDPTNPEMFYIARGAQRRTWRRTTRSRSALSRSHPDALEVIEVWAEMKEKSPPGYRTRRARLRGRRRSAPLQSRCRSPIWPENLWMGVSVERRSNGQISMCFRC